MVLIRFLQVINLQTSKILNNSITFKYNHGRKYHKSLNTETTILPFIFRIQELPGAFPKENLVYISARQRFLMELLHVLYLQTLNNFFYFHKSLNMKTSGDFAHWTPNRATLDLLGALRLAPLSSNPRDPPLEQAPFCKCAILL